MKKENNEYAQDDIEKSSERGPKRENSNVGI